MTKVLIAWLWHTVTWGDWMEEVVVAVRNMQQTVNEMANTMHRLSLKIEDIERAIEELRKEDYAYG